MAETALGRFPASKTFVVVVLFLQLFSAAEVSGVFVKLNPVLNFFIRRIGLKRIFRLMVQRRCVNWGIFAGKQHFLSGGRIQQLMNLFPAGGVFGR